MDDNIKRLADDADAKQVRLLGISRQQLNSMELPAVDRVRVDMALDAARSASWAADQTLKNALIALDAELARDKKMDGNVESRAERAAHSRSGFEEESGARE